eukprot:768373-Hanusia_phi.AAC.13
MQREDSSSSVDAALDLGLDDLRKEGEPPRQPPRERGGPFERCVVACTPAHAFGPAMQSYVENQINMPRKQWIYEVIDGTREQDNVLLDTPDMVFLPDTHALNDGKTINWLAVIKDRSLRSLRDLRGRHVKMLKRVRLLCTEYILANTSWKRHNIMAYVHYLPSVFQLHIHFCAPYGSYTTLDVFKVHPLDSVIGNLDMDGDYYRKATLSTIVVGNAGLLAVYGLNVVRNDYRNVESHEVDPIQWRGILG